MFEHIDTDILAYTKAHVSIYVKSLVFRYIYLSKYLHTNVIIFGYRNVESVVAERFRTVLWPRTL